MKTLLAVMMLTALLHAESAGEPPDKGKQVIDQVVHALGGDAFLQMKTRISSGRIYSFFHDRTSGAEVTRMYNAYDAEVPAKGLGVREREVLGKKQDYSYLFLSDQAFDITFRGARPIPDEDWQKYERTTMNDILYFLRFRLKEPGLQFDYIGSEVYLSMHVEVVEVSDMAGRIIRLSIDHNTMLPVRATFNWLDPVTKQRQDEETNYSKWRNAGNGVMWPFTIERQRNGYKVFQIFADRVEIDQELPAGIFDLPAGAKVLRKIN